MEFKLSIEKEVTKKYDYKTAKIKGFKTLTQLGLPSGYLGGRIHRIAELKDKDVLLALDHLSNVIGILEPLKKVSKKQDIVEEVKEEVKEEEADLSCSCDKCGKEFKSMLGLNGHKRFCKGE